MAADHATPEGITYRTEAGTVRAAITPDPGTAEHDLLAIVADLEGVAIEDLPSLYTQVDHFVELLLGDPPATEAQMEISYSYAGYRITQNRKGQVKLLNVKDAAEDL